jgi:hypothetical protein
VRDSGLITDSNGQTRTLHSVRHTCATLELQEKGTDIQTLSKQMDNSVVMKENITVD